ncbi:hypothetical protein [Dehalobacterium formicoaceticum]|uniref:Cytochrome c domain-containing protein n=1 Tax=Dehalobacterium formicoaceticum TaxID=51515 RepID=A0ABT1Y709_9FIRM|nr:hypothetical protein [Dehalobacterium formicoaceticum]MCR6546657.1 hypothetical protein [Dehalobacterium formicoaceticum]
MSKRSKTMIAVFSGILILAGISGIMSMNKENESSAPTASLNDLLSIVNPQANSLSPDMEKSTPERLKNGQQIFRFDTFGDEAYWGDTLKLHQAIAGEKLGGVGPGLSPKDALAVGLKVDAQALPPSLVRQLKAGKVDLDDPANTLALLKNNAVLGVTGFFDEAGKLTSMGIQCALCHSTVDDSLAPGIGKRLDGRANRDLNVGAIISLAPNINVIADRLGVDVPTVKKVLAGWGPGKYDAVLLEDGKGFRPDGKSAATLLPPAFGLSGINLHTWTGWGSVPHWNAYVANTQMGGKGTFFDPRLNDPKKYPIAVKTGDWNIRNSPDLISSKLPDLHLYQLALTAPKAPESSYNKEAAARGETLFNGKATCARCHVPPLYSEPGWNMHTPKEMGIDAFQADRSPDNMYRTAPLAGLWTHQKGGFYHDGRFADLNEVINHYNNLFKLKLTENEKRDLREFLLSI